MHWTPSMPIKQEFHENTNEARIAEIKGDEYTSFKCKSAIFSNFCWKGQNSNKFIKNNQK